jgi:tetratricopeptide (TPR) repeat protein
MRLRALPPAALFLALVAAPTPARAQDAVALFDQGRALVAQEKWAAACPLFNEAHRLQKEAIGIVMNLGECYRHIGKNASAWSAFREAEFLAKKQNDPGRAQYAHEQGALLEPGLSRLKIDAEATPGLIIHRDEQEIGPGVLGTAFPIDPGPHKIEATAPGYRVWSTTVVIGAGRDQQSVAIPALGKGSDGDGGGSGGGVLRPVGFAAIAVGGAGLVAGAITLALDASKHATLLQSCPAGRCAASSEATLQAQVDSYHTLGLVSTASFIAGGALAATGVVLVLVAPKASQQSVGVSPVLGPRYAGLAGRF